MPIPSAKEPDLLEEAKKRSWEVDHIPGEELEALAKEVIDQPPEIVIALCDGLALR